MKKLKTLEQRVINVLKKSVKARDNSRLLISKIWDGDMIFTHVNVYLKEEFLEGKLTHPDNITRIARKVKAENPSLRGKNYKQRKKDEQTGKRILKHK